MREPNRRSALPFAFAFVAVSGAIVGTVMATGCGSKSSPSGFSPTGSDDSGIGSGDMTDVSADDTGSGLLGGGNGPDAASTAPDANVTADCPPSAKLIYVTGEGSQLYSFAPQTAKFTLIGTLTCLDSPTHMTVDRTGTAWVVSDGNLYKASTTTAACSAVATWTPDPINFGDFALTFLGTTNATDNTLYMLGDFGELGAFNTVTGHVTSMGTVSLQPSGDMTTNGDGTLYFLMQAEMQTLNQLNPTNASVIKSWTTGEDSENSQALAYYGGLFYDFIGNAVYTYDTTTGVAKSLGMAPLMVTGAGQSTCVPSVAPPPAPLPQ